MERISFTAVEMLNSLFMKIYFINSINEKNCLLIAASYFLVLIRLCTDFSRSYEFTEADAMG